MIEFYCVHRRDSRLEPPLAHSLNHLGICQHALSLHVRKSTQGEAEYTTCLTSSGDIQNHLFLAVLSTQLKIFLIKKKKKMPSKRCLHFYLNLALQIHYHIKGRNLLPAGADGYTAQKRQVSLGGLSYSR